MLNKLTIIGIVIGCAISILGAASMVTSLNTPNEIQEDTATFGVGDLDKINFNAPENSSQTLTITGGIRSGLSYCGGHTIQQMQTNAEFIKMSRAGFAESQPHDVDVV